MKALKKIYLFLFFLGIFFLPFNSQPPEFLNLLGEYRTDSSPLFFLLAFCVLFTRDFIRGKVSLPFTHPVYFVFIILFAWITVSIFFNFQNVSTYYFKQTSGWIRYLKQIASVVIAFLMFFYLFYNVCIELGLINAFKKTRKIMLYSLIIVFIAGLLQFLIYAGVSPLIPVFQLFDYFPFTETKLYYTLSRVNAISVRPPDLGMYLISISGFMFSYILTEKKSKILKFLPFVFVLFLAYVSKSRTALLTIFIQIIILVVWSYKNYATFRKVLNRAFLFSLFFIPFILYFKGEVIYEGVEERIESLNFTSTNSANAVSNKSRFGIQYANFQVYKKYPITGIGWGQQAFESKDLYPRWATTNNWEFKGVYLNENEKSFPPGYNLFLRFMTETGTIGFIIFSCFVLLMFYYTFLYSSKSNPYRYVPITIMITLLGAFLNWFQMDSFRLYTFWLALAMLICYKPLYTNRINEVK